MFFSQFVYSWKFSILEYNVTNDGNTSSVLTDNLCDQPHSNILWYQMKSIYTYQI